uniref:Ig-like domain-containing protein n=1 Tax=Esox lucius TaxID=8010 RepID=A0A6Q2YME1_ESOLU
CFPEALLLRGQNVALEQVLDQSPSQVIKPGDSVKLSCKTSEFNMTSYYMHWIRQKPGKGLEWIGNSLKGQFTLTEDVPTSTQFLEAKNLRAEDTAVYYCINHYHCDYYFDYWGKGTEVTVTSATATAPTLFPLAQCGSGPRDMLTLGCMATGFTPPSITFKWKDSTKTALTDFIQYPSVQSNGKYMGVSQLSIKKADWDTKDFVCAVEHSAGNKEVTIRIPVLRVTPPKIDLHHFWEGKSKVGFHCTLREFYPDNLSVEWLVDGKSSTIQSVQIKEQNTVGEKTFTLSSQMVMNQWTEGSEVTCKATNNEQSYNETINIFSSIPSINLEIPRLRAVMTKGEVYVSCQVQCPFENVTISWFLNGNILNEKSKVEKSNETIISNLTLSSDHWKTLNNITCRVEHPCFTAKEKTSQLKGLTPSVMIRRSLPDLLTRDSALLECVITNLSSSDFYVTFQANGVNISKEQYVDLPASKDLYSITRLFSVPKLQWQKNMTFTCKVNQGFLHSWESNSTGSFFEDLSMELYLVPNRSDSKTQRLVCSGLGFNPQIKWLSESVQISAPVNDIRIGEDGRVAVTSFITIQQQEWNDGKNFTCEVIDNMNTIRKYIDICAVTPKSSQKVGVYLQGPALQELKTGGHGTVTCILLGPNLGEFSVSCKVGENESLPKRVTQEPINHPNGTQSVKVVFNVSATTWQANTTVSCEVRHRCSDQTQEVNITKGPDPKPPSIKLLRPSESDLLESENVTLLCLVSGFFPSDVIVKWKHDGSDLPSSRYSNGPSVQYAGSSTYYMNSRLVVPKAESYQNSNYSCVVRHESSDTPIERTIDQVFASVIPSRPTATLLQGSNELVCLVFGFSPSAINITWLLDDSTELSDHNTSTPYWSPGGKYSVWSTLRLTNQDWPVGSVYTCRVTHSTQILTVNIFTSGAHQEQCHMTNNPILADTAEENWNMACIFIILFLISLLYSITITLVRTTIHSN